MEGLSLSLVGGSLVAQVPSVSAPISLYRRRDIDIEVIDYMVHQYGSSEDYDKLAALTGDSGWSWNNMKQYITRVCLPGMVRATVDSRSQLAREVCSSSGWARHYWSMDAFFTQHHWDPTQVPTWLPLPNRRPCDCHYPGTLC